MFLGGHHLAVAVRSLDQALRFYHETLGLPVGTQATVADQGVTAALLPIGDSELELLEPVNPAGGVAKFLEKKGEGPHHLCLETTDVASALREAQACGLALIDQAPRRGLAGLIGFLHPAATGGVLVEIAQPGAPAGHAAPAPTAGIGAVGVEAVCVGTKDPVAAGAVYARNFGARVAAPSADPALGARTVVAEIGRSRILLVDVTGDEANLVAGRSEGLLGVSLRVQDFDAAVQRLAESGVAVTVRRRANGRRLGRLETDRSHGVLLLIAA